MPEKELNDVLLFVDFRAKMSVTVARWKETAFLIRPGCQSLLQPWTTHLVIERGLMDGTALRIRKKVNRIMYSA